MMDGIARARTYWRGLTAVGVIAVLAFSTTSSADSPSGVTVIGDGHSFELQYTATTSPDELLFDQLLGYDVVEFADGGLQADVGKPMLPTRTLRLALPAGMTVTAVRCTMAGSIELPGTYAIMPAQPPHRVSEPATASDFVGPDPAVYASPDAYPDALAEFTHQNDLAGQSIAYVRVCPLQYIPADQKLILHTAINVVLEGVTGYECGDYLPPNAPAEMRNGYERAVAGMVINPEDVALQPSRDPAPLTRGVAPGDYDYVIITTYSWEDDFQPLVDWKTRKGVPATTVSTAWIYNDGGYSGTEQQKIRAFVQDAHNTWGTMYFLLGGDTNIVPYHTRTISGDDIPNDTYYADYDSDWLCEVHVGRVAARDTTEVSTFVNKTLTYETNPPLSNYTKIAAFFGFDLNQYGSDEGEGCKTYIHSYYLAPDWTLRREYDSESGSHKSDVIGYLNQGSNIVNHIDHSSTDSMGAGYTNHGDTLSNSDMNGLTNGDRQSILYSIGCWACDYPDTTCIAESFVQNTGGGGLAFIGNSRYGWYSPYQDDYYSLRFDRYFFRSLFVQNHTTLGECFSDHKNDAYQNDDTMEYIYTELTLLGDPELPIWTDTPPALSATHPSTVSAGQPATFQVQVNSGGNPVSSARVCLWKADDVYDVALTNSSGVASFTFTPVIGGTLLVTATKHDYLPYQGTADVIAGTTFDLVVNIDGDGYVDLDPPGGSYPSGTTVELTAHHLAGAYFDHWEGDLWGSDNPEAILMNGDKVVTAVFGPDCNGNGVPDDQDIANGTSIDCQPNGVPDECEVGNMPFTVSYSLNTNPGWTTEDDWAWGQPTGGGGEYGGPDPTSGHTGSNVYGYNLSGDYPNNLPERHLTTTAIDCTGVENVQLSFWRWLGVEQPLYDHAYVRVSNNGTNWVTIWENTAEITDSSWTQQTFDISQYADNQPTVYLRWTMGSTDGGWRYCGWNIDDIEITGVMAGGGEGDCNDNGVPDECDVADGTSEDCNNNGVPDECDIADGTSWDANGNGIPDECEGGADCNNNGVSDDQDIASGTSQDCNFNGIPDECEDESRNGLAAAYYDGPAFSGLLLGRIDETVNFDWGDGAPWAVFEGDSFCVRWTGFIQTSAASGDYTFYTITDDGVRLWINGELIIDHWQNQAATEWSGTISLEGNHGYQIAMEYYEYLGQASAQLSWQPPGAPRTIIPPSVLIPGLDCNNNASPDSCDLAYGVSQDCNDNAVPDECDIADGTSEDCNENAVPDECDIVDGTSEDCNDNAVPDECDIADGTSQDCNDNAVPDECDIADGTSQDCNENSVPDECDIADGTSEDCNENAVPDECDIADGTSEDCNENGVPDECDIADGTSEDCNDNGVPDECDIADGTSEDCNENGVPDECDIADGTSEDCNENGVPDECDIADGTSQDTNGNGIPDECEPSLTGDLDCDGDVDFDDINPFVLALSGEDQYLAEYPDCNWLNADCNSDGTVDFDDINPFVALLGG